MNRHHILLHPRRTSAYRTICLAAVVLFISACSSTRVGHDFDRSARFDGYHTYAWLPRAHDERQNPLAARFAKESIEEELNEKGFTLVPDPQAADIAVDFTLGARDRIDISAYPKGYRSPWQWGRWYNGDLIDIRQYREATLAVDVFDAKTHEPIWTGWATKDITRADQTRAERPIRTAAAAVLAQFPPPSNVEAKTE